MSTMLSPTIHVTHLAPVERGAIMAVYCRVCRVTEFFVSEYGCRPSRGDFFLLNDFCFTDLRHGMPEIEVKYSFPTY